MSKYSVMLHKGNRLTNRVLGSKKKAVKFRRRAKRLGYSDIFLNGIAPILKCLK